MMNENFIDSETSAALSQLLDQLIKNTEIKCAVVLNRSGHILSEINEYQDLSMNYLADNITNGFTSIINILDTISNTETSGLRISNTRKRMQLTLPSNNRIIHISIIDEDTYFAVIFDRKVLITEIKPKITYYGIEIGKIMESFYKKVLSESSLDMDLSDNPIEDNSLDESESE